MFRDSFWGLSGFNELRAYIKQGNEFCKEVAVLLQERSELESTYAKSLHKISSKLAKAANNCIGTLASAWSMAATEMEAEAELHRVLAQALHEDIYKPMKNLAETQYKTRKPINSVVDKAMTTLADRRNEEAKHKKMSYASAKEREKLCEQYHNARHGKGKVMSEKDIAKLEKKVRQAEETMSKADKEFHDSCLKAESARQEWESSVYKGSGQLQTIEEERISQMQDLLNKFNSHLSVVGPKLVQSCERLGEAVLSVDTNADLRTVVDQKGTGPNQPEQSLLDFYAEEFNNSMDKDRRRQALTNYLVYLQQDIERENKGKEGVEKLVEVYQNRPNFADAEAQEDARNRLSHVTSSINFLEANHHKISCAMATLEGRTKPTSKFSQYIVQTKDKQGQTTSTLRLPAAMLYSGADCGSPSYRGPADGGHVDSAFDDDEFDTYDGVGDQVLCQCRAIYDYAATMYDELTIKPGDIINVYDKQQDGWWQGELSGQVGIFPATYVEEI